MIGSHIMLLVPKCRPGYKVVVHGLQNATELNGRLCTIVAWREKRKRYEVRLDGDEHGTKAIKAANLRQHEAATESS